MFFEVSVNLVRGKQSPVSSQCSPQSPSHCEFQDIHLPRVTATSEGERRKDAWMPMERTRKVLAAKASRYPLKTDLEMLTMPGVGRKHQQIGGN